jgi:hypothetical protein
MSGLDEHLHGTDLFGDPIAPPSRGPLSDRFGTPPFTVLNSREGDWQSRKQSWIRVGIKSEEGRDAAVGGSKMVAGYDEDGNRQTGLVTESDTSIFDPVLCELIYRWWSPKGGRVLDPFAGGSVRGIIAGALEREYHGIELREEQVEANRIQAEELGEKLEPFHPPHWTCGDSMEVLPRYFLDDPGPDGPKPFADFLFSCPPYGDLEVYSDLPEDLSTMSPEGFAETYRAIIERAVDRLLPDRFACFVVGDYRDKSGRMLNFPALTIEAFLDAGCDLYNEAILVTPVGSAGMRAPRQFAASRKLVKTHQNVLVFCKGDGRKAADFCKAADPKELA